MKKFAFALMFPLSVLMLVNSCGDEGFILMPRSQEINLGEQLDSTILANSVDYPVLERNASTEPAYVFLENLMTEILANDQEDFYDGWEWKITIIDENVMNAFAAPGGKLYFYTGLMKYLENTAQLAGVMAHEMAHVELRHSARQMQAAYGMNFAASILFGTDKSQLEEIISDIASGLAALQFSRDDEYQADEYSVKYLTGTNKYDPRGISGFFEKLQSEGKSNDGWEVLSSHPSDAERIENILTVWKSLGQPGGDPYENEYTNFKTSLP